MIGSDGSINDSLTDHTKNKCAVVDSEYISDTNPWDNGTLAYYFSPTEISLHMTVLRKKYSIFKIGKYCASIVFVLQLYVNRCKVLKAN